MVLPPALVVVCARARAPRPAAAAAAPASNMPIPRRPQVATSLLVNVLLARLCLRLGWNAGFIRTGAFFGDKGPAYDEEEVGGLLGIRQGWGVGGLALSRCTPACPSTHPQACDGAGGLTEESSPPPPFRRAVEEVHHQPPVDARAQGQVQLRELLVVWCGSQLCSHRRWVCLPGHPGHSPCEQGRGRTGRRGAARSASVTA